MKSALCFLILQLAATWSSAQTFEVASIKLNKAGSAGGEGATRESISHNPGTLTMRNVTLKSAIRWAYGAADYGVSAPSWIDSLRYDIQARASEPVAREQLGFMRKDRIDVLVIDSAGKNPTEN